MSKNLYAIILLLSGTTVFAQQNVNKTAPAPEEKPDLTGTNAALFNNIFITSNEFDGINNNKYFNTAKLRYAAALTNRKVILRLPVPFNTTNVTLTGNSETGFGDFSALVAIKFPVCQKIILLANMEAVINTASQKSPSFGQEKSTSAPLITTVFMVWPNVIFAPSILPKFSYAGNSNRAAINQTQIDLYFVYKPTPVYWIILDPQGVSDYNKSNRLIIQAKMEIGRMIEVVTPPHPEINSIIRGVYEAGNWIG